MSDATVTTSPADHPLAPYDALWLVSFGGPEKADEVVDFLEVVTRGSGIPRERLATVGEHYFLFGGRSPINDQNRALIAALHDELARRGADLPIHWGNRNWHPFVDESLDEAVAAGHRRLLMLTTSAYPSYAGCRSYREAVAEALAGRQGVRVDRVGNYGLSDGFVGANADALRAALAELPGARVVFVTHSIPTDMDGTSGDEDHRGAYTQWHREVAGRVAASAGAGDFDLVFCSRSGRPGQPWLEPDVNDHLEELHARGVERVVLAPIGFVSDHMEVVYDLDTQARETCERLGIEMVRCATAGTAPRFVAALADLVLARAAQARDAAEAGCALWTADGCGGPGCCPNLKAPQAPAID